jgi:hypothetical protein
LITQTQTTIESAVGNLQNDLTTNLDKSAVGKGASDPKHKPTQQDLERAPAVSKPSHLFFIELPICSFAAWKLRGRARGLVGFGSSLDRLPPSRLHFCQDWKYRFSAQNFRILRVFFATSRILRNKKVIDRHRHFLLHCATNAFHPTQKTPQLRIGLMYNRVFGIRIYTERVPLSAGDR